jgi:hypothetical protein
MKPIREHFALRYPRMQRENCIAVAEEPMHNDSEGGAQSCYADHDNEDYDGGLSVAQLRHCTPVRLDLTSLNVGAVRKKPSTLSAWSGRHLYGVRQKAGLVNPSPH